MKLPANTQTTLQSQTTTKNNGPTTNGTSADMATDPLGNLPRYVIFRGRKARILHYEDGKFTILDHTDSRYCVTRDRIIFPRRSK